MVAMKTRRRSGELTTERALQIVEEGRARSHFAREAPKVLRASGVRIHRMSAEKMRAIAGQRQAWQTNAWGYRDMIGELRFALRFRAMAISGVRFYMAQTNPDLDDDQPLPLSLRNDEDPDKAAQITVS
ncbi:MAG TPA: hypothetical protein VL915_05645, partial [Gemmatimonadales bacterium]|nr:hypothetical protein [Gemmatimonadales bacterium]